MRQFENDTRKLNQLIAKKADKADGKPMTAPQKQLLTEKKKKTEHLSGKFLLLLKQRELPIPIRELMFHPVRKWRFDFAWPDHKIALEVEGGLYINGGHSRGQAFEKDIDKYNQAGLLGWTVLRTAPDDLNSTKTLELLQAILIKK